MGKREYVGGFTPETIFKFSGYGLFTGKVVECLTVLMFFP